MEVKIAKNVFLSHMISRAWNNKSNNVPSVKTHCYPRHFKTPPRRCQASLRHPNGPKTPPRSPTRCSNTPPIRNPNTRKPSVKAPPPVFCGQQPAPYVPDTFDVQGVIWNQLQGWRFLGLIPPAVLVTAIGVLENKQWDFRRKIP